MNDPLAQQTAPPLFAAAETPAQFRIRQLAALLAELDTMSDAKNLSAWTRELVANRASNHAANLRPIVETLRAQEIHASDVNRLTRAEHAGAMRALLRSQLQILEWSLTAHLKPINLDPPAAGDAKIRQLIQGIGGMLALYNEAEQLAGEIRGDIERDDAASAAQGGAR